MASIKKLEFPSGTDVTEPSDLSVTNSANHLETYASDAAFVSANGTAVAGDFYLNTSAENPRVYVSGAWKDVGSGGAGGRNYLSSEFEGTRAVGTVTNGLTATGNRSANQDTWGADNTAKLTIANNTSSPLRQTGDFKITHVTTGTAFIESRMFNLDTADLNKAISISFDLTGNTTAGDFDIVVMRYNSSGTYQETISVAGTASSGSPASALLPTGTTKFNGFFISSNTQTDYYSLRFRRLSGSATTSVQFDSFFVGPQNIITGFVGTDGLSYTPTSNGLGTLTNIDVQYRRVGQYLHIDGKFDLGTLTASEARIGLPTGLTIATFAQDTHIAGTWSENNTSSSNDKWGWLLASSGHTYLRFALGGDYNTTSSPLSPINGNAGLSSLNTMAVSAQVRIAQWTSNTTLAERAVEVYASNSNNTAGTASDTTSFVSGNKGSLLITSTPAGNSITRRVRFDTPILNTDFFSYEISDDGVRFYPVAAQLTASGLVDALHYDGTNYIGFGGAQPVAGSTTDIDVYFGKYRTGTSIAWSGAGYWRVRKVSGGTASVGYPIAPANITLINSSDNYSGNTKLGFMPYLHGTTYNGGVAPTVTLSGGGGTLTTVNRAVFIPYQLADATWRVRFNISVTLSATVRTSATLSVNGLTFKTVAKHQAIAGWNDNGLSTQQSVALTGASTLNSSHSSGTTDAYEFSGDVELDSKPTWAY